LSPEKLCILKNMEKNNTENGATASQKNIEQLGYYWYNRGYRDQALREKVEESLSGGELVDDGDSCKVCE
jgi:hypothetical protein